MILVPYQPWHYESLLSDTSLYPVLGRESVEMLAMAYSMRGMSFSVKDNGKIVGAGGILELWPGVGEAWSVFSKRLKCKPFFLHRRASRILADMIKMRQYHRIQAVIDESDYYAVSWARRLGFRWESVMKKFGADGKDYAMYVRLKEKVS
jgi:hypothetical protein